MGEPADATPPTAEQRPAPAHASVASGVYGTIIAGSVLATMVNEPMPDIVLAVLVTVLVYWIAERYADTLAGLAGAGHVSWTRLRHSIRITWPMVQASYAPLIVLVAAYALGAPPQTAVLIALIFSTGVLATLGFQAGRRGGLSRPALVATTAASAALGLCLIALKVMLK